MIQIKIYNILIELEDWRQDAYIPQTYYRLAKDENGVRFIANYISVYFDDYHKCYIFRFVGPLIEKLQIFYDAMYDKKYFIFFSLEDVQKHIDSFLVKYNNLGVFL